MDNKMPKLKLILRRSFVCNSKQHLDETLPKSIEAEVHIAPWAGPVKSIEIKKDH